MSGGLAQGRLAAERKAWRRDHPYGFMAKPEKRPDGSQNLFQWKCLVPGPPGTDWAPANTTWGHYPVRLVFGTDYPSSPPTCYFDANFFHPNVYPSGKICLDIISNKAWKPSVTVKQILLGIQMLLKEPNNSDAANSRAYTLFNQKAKYKVEVRKQAKKYPLPI